MDILGITRRADYIGNRVYGDTFGARSAGPRDAKSQGIGRLKHYTKSILARIGMAGCTPAHEDGGYVCGWFIAAGDGSTTGAGLRGKGDHVPRGVPKTQLADTGTEFLWGKTHRHVLPLIKTYHSNPT